MRKRFGAKIIILFCVMLAAWSNALAAESNANEAETVVEKANLECKAITRQPDPITISGNQLEGFTGLAPELLGLYVVRENNLVPIPFQVDQKDEDGEYILVGVEEKKQAPTPPFDANDEIVFMAKDLGDRLSPESYPPARQKGVEIEVIDPVNQARGWGYLFSFASPPARSERAYTRYMFPRDGTDVVVTDVFTMEFPPVEENRAINNSGLIIAKAAGGSGENFLDRMKSRASFEFLFSFFKLTVNEDTMRAELVAYKDGPVHVFRRNKIFIPLGFGLKSPGLLADIYYYETALTAPVDYFIPFRFGTVLSSVTYRVGFDYLPNVKGSKWYNSLNLKGLTLDGKPTLEEENMNHKEAEWNLLTGPMGTVMRRNVKTGLTRKYFKIEEYLSDNEKEPDPPENHPGNFGHSYQLWDLTNLPRGNYKLIGHFFILPNFKWGDQYEYLKIDDAPLRVVVNNLDLLGCQLPNSE